MKKIIKFIKNNFVLVLICFLFLGTRLFRISEIPASVYWDEASIGYNAYSVLTTGKDEWGEFIPLHFRAFGEFKLPVYVYSVAVAVKLFGLNEFSVRLPAVLYSFGSLILVYLITKKITKSEISSLFSSFFFTISPWGMIITRVGYEVTSGVFFFLLALYTFFISLKKPKYFLLSMLFHILAIYSYNSFRIISPAFFIVSSLFLLKKKNLYIILTSLFILLLFFIPIYRLFRYDFGGLRYQAVGLQGPLADKGVLFAKNYLSHFSPKFLFVSGDANPRSHVPGWGEFYWISIPVLILGMISLAKNISTKYILFVLLLSVIPAAITKESPHALRSFLMFPV